MELSLKRNLTTLHSYLNNKNDDSYIFISKTNSIINHQVIAKNENSSWDIVHNIETDNVLSEAGLEEKKRFNLRYSLLESELKQTQERLNKINSEDYYDIESELKSSKEDNAVYREQIKGLEKDNRLLGDRLSKLVKDNESLSDKLNSLTVDYERILKMYEDSIVENERLKLSLPTNGEIQSRYKRKNVEADTSNKNKRSKKILH